MNTISSSINNLSGESDFIKWDPKFALGITYIDEQHKHLVELCSKLYTQIMSNRSSFEDQSDAQWKQALVVTLKECVNYVGTHFSDEEKLMKLAAYEGYVLHKQRHDEFTKKILDTARQFSSMTFTDAIKFCKFLYEWILSHIAHEDKLYVKFINV